MKKIILLFMIAATILALTACGRPSLSEEEAVRVIRPLVEKAEVLNEIYFGGGIPVEDSTARLHAFFDATGLKEETATYLPVSRDSLYQTKNALLAETKTVFTAAYAAYLEELGFRGIQDGSDDEVSIGEAHVIYARYKVMENVFEYGDKVLCVRVNLDTEDVGLAKTEFLYDELEILKGGKQDGSEWIRVKIPARVFDEAGEVRTTVDVTLRIVNENGAWRLDSPTYVSKSVYLTEEE